MSDYRWGSPSDLAALDRWITREQPVCECDARGCCEEPEECCGACGEYDFGPEPEMPDLMGEAYYRAGED